MVGSGAAARHPSLYALLGGEDGVRSLVETFYDIVEQDEEAQPLHLLHKRGHGLAHSRIEQFNFLSGFFGGPPLYSMKYGRANLKEMHAHVEIGPDMRDMWLICMGRALDKRGLEPELKARLMKHFTVAAETSRNKD